MSNSTLSTTHRTTIGTTTRSTLSTARRLTVPALLTTLTAGLAASLGPAQAHALTADATAPSALVWNAYEVEPGTRFHRRPSSWTLPVEGYHLTGRFGDVSGLWSTVHTGLDFATSTGTPIHAIAPGVVVETAYDGAYGNRTILRLDDGTELWFCHQDSFVAQVGTRLEAGDLLGYVGATGNVTGPHLHLEVHPGGGEPVDPEAWLTTHLLRP
jgi:murein DD-endopeptidase MepM/ murein hydrolase activator NlpD